MATPCRRKRVAPLLATAGRSRTVVIARRSWLAVLSVLLLAATTPSSLPPLVTAATVEPTQFASLTSLRTDLDINLPSWEATADCTTFERVVCDDSGNVIELALDEIKNSDGDYITEVFPAITGLTRLSKLNLDNNNIMYFSTEITDMTSLKVLSLRYNMLTTFPFSGFPSLEELDMYIGKLTGIPPSVSELSNLVRLSLSYNYITDIATEFTSLTKLEQLKMHDNFMKTFPFSGLYSLTYLDLYNDLLTSIPPSITQLSSLTFMDMGSNMITDIATELTALTKLAKILGEVLRRATTASERRLARHGGSEGTARPLRALLSQRLAITLQRAQAQQFRRRAAEWAADAALEEDVDRAQRALLRREEGPAEADLAFVGRE